MFSHSFISGTQGIGFSTGEGRQGQRVEITYLSSYSYQIEKDFYFEVVENWDHAYVLGS
jgi:hypothetical protein